MQKDREKMGRKKESSTLSVISSQGLTATISSSAAAAAAAAAAETTTSSASSDNHGNRSWDPTNNTTSNGVQKTLDFIGTGDAVKSLFSIPYHSSNRPLCLAVHNLEGTLLIDQTVNIDDGDYDDGKKKENEKEPEPEQQQNIDRIGMAEPSSSSSTNAPAWTDQLLALALSPTNKTPDVNISSNKMKSSSVPQQQQQQKQKTEGLSLLSKVMITPKTTTSKAGEPSSPHDNPLTPVREFLEWNFQDMKLLVGSDTIVIRSEPPDLSSNNAVSLRVENVHRLNQLMDQENIIQQQRREQQQPPPSTAKETLSYAQVVAKEPKEQDSNDSESKESTTALNLDQVRLQTCIVPSSEPLGALLESSSSATTTALRPVESAVDPALSPLRSAPPGTEESPLCIVLDAYLDNVMANVPQLALCLEEKGVIQSVKLLNTEQIPSMMMHPSTLDTSKPLDTCRPSDDTVLNELFSPKVMELNANALLRFLKQNCTRNNATYLLLREPGDSPNNIQLYDISSISAQRQKKWIWWLATMSYRFALRLRQCQASVPHQQQRAFRDRQRGLYQTTLDLLQDLLDMDGNAHESLVASVREHMADTFLGEEALQHNTQSNHPEDRNSPPPVMTSASPPKHDESIVEPPLSPAKRNNNQNQQHEPGGTQQQPYAKVTVDSLNKAHDHLVHGIKTLWPVLESHLKEPSSPTTTSSRRRKRGRVVGNNKPTAENSEIDPPPMAMVMQLFGLNYKDVNVSLRLAEHHLRNYYSSSAMQALRNAARRMADSASLLVFMEANQYEWIQRLQLQHTWLWEHCGHFARSFASDELWRDRGHASGDDVIYVLRDVEAAFLDEKSNNFIVRDYSEDSLSKKTDENVSLQSLSGIVRPDNMSEIPAGKSIAAAKRVLSEERVLQRDKRQVLVASCISYRRAISTFQELLVGQDPSQATQRGRNHLFSTSGTTEAISNGSNILNLLRQRLGDACNETGKMLLAALRSLILNFKSDEETQMAAEALLDSAQFWFLEGLDTFGACHDLRNLALLRCNLCQCSKLRANSCFTSQASEGASHAEVCLQEAANHLQAAHEAMGERDVDPMTWDMVSEELAATFLVLGVRRRQNLLGGGTAPVIFQAMRLPPGKERSITEPMEQALKIYQQSGNVHQAAAVHYQLALTHSKTWTCQRDETKTREKLSAAFSHYNMAFAYFSTNLRGNEPTFVLLCLDLASLYAAVSGVECTTKALSRCLDTRDAFSQDAIDASRSNSDWMGKMETLAESVEDRVFKLLRSLVKLEPDRYKDLYREALTAKMVKNVPEEEESNEKLATLLSLHDVLLAIRKKING